ncbi:MAG TPA: hypothetical protein VIW03_09585 [Anaeromyxobacter sp.]
MRFREHIGIDYSGAGDPAAGCSGLRAYRSRAGREALEVRPDAATSRRWSRVLLARWLAETLRAPDPVIVGIDHCFSFPKPWLAARRLVTWDAFLARFCAEWPTDREAVGRCRPAGAYAAERVRLRLCERWTSSAKSVYQFGMNGQVAASSHAGIPWLRRLRGEAGASVHFWPFDGWVPPPGKHVVAEIYPSILRNRFPRAGRTADQQDAYAVAEWLRTRDAAGLLAGYFEPMLTGEERAIAGVEGWILGIL